MDTSLKKCVNPIEIVVTHWKGNVTTISMENTDKDRYLFCFNRDTFIKAKSAQNVNILIYVWNYLVQMT